MIKLYRKNSVGLGTWRIWADTPGFDQCSIYYAHAITESATEIMHSDLVTTNNSGRNIAQQVELEINSRVGRMLDKGYKRDRDEALAGASNQMGLIGPMLAQTLSGRPQFDLAHVQPKLNGHRCLITNHDGDILAYTRKGKPITTIPHILQDFAWLPEGRTVDGELYIHGLPLQTISSLIKRQQARSAEIRFHWYDFIGPKVFAERFKAIEKAAFVKPMTHVDVVDTFQVRDMEQAYKLFRHFRELKYEGAMLRLSIAGYQGNLYRSPQLLKMKERDDCEVIVRGATQSRDGWAVLQVEVLPRESEDKTKPYPQPGRIFDISAPGTVAEKTEVWNNLSKYIGRKLKIEYAELTSDGVPFHAVAIEWFEEL